MEKVIEEQKNGDMDIRITFIFCLALVIGVGLPAAAYFFTRGENTVTLAESLRRATQTARQPWKKTDDDLDELARRVDALRGDPENKGASGRDLHEQEE